MTECPHTEDVCECDRYPDEPFGDEQRWRCSLYGCMWAVHTLIDRARGFRPVNVTPYRVIARRRAQQAAAAEAALGPPQQELFA